MTICNWRDEWRSAFDKATFYHSDKKTKEYWDAMAQSDKQDFSEKEHVRFIRDYMFGEKLLNAGSTILDAGCGTGDYVVDFAEKWGTLQRWIIQKIC